MRYDRPFDTCSLGCVERFDEDAFYAYMGGARVGLTPFQMSEARYWLTDEQLRRLWKLYQGGPTDPACLAEHHWRRRHAGFHDAMRASDAIDAHAADQLGECDPAPSDEIATPSDEEKVHMNEELNVESLNIFRAEDSSDSSVEVRVGGTEPELIVEVAYGDQVLRILPEVACEVAVLMIKCSNDASTRNEARVARDEADRHVRENILGLEIAAKGNAAAAEALELYRRAMGVERDA